MESLTVSSVVEELKRADSYEDILKIGAKVKEMIKENQNSPFLPMDIYDLCDDKVKARRFMMGVICN